MNESLPDQSKKVDLISGALAKAQGEMNDAERKGKNSFLGNTYADLSSILHVIREPFSKNGLAVSQTFETNESQVVLVSKIFHSSGQFISSRLGLLPFSDAHQLGSAITYARRYSISALCAISQQDDDGETAMARGKKSPPKRKVAPKKAKASDLVEDCQTIIGQVDGAEDYLRGKEIDPGDPPANIRNKILELGPEGLKKKIIEARKQEEAEEIIANADKVDPVKEEDAA